MTGKFTVSELTVSELTCQRVGLSASYLVSELTVSELVCQRDVCEAWQRTTGYRSIAGCANYEHHEH